MKKSTVALAVATAMGASGAANAAAWDLADITTWSSNGPAVLALSGDLSFESDADSNLISNGSFSGLGRVGATPLFTHAWGAGTTVGGDGTITGQFDCLEGVFGGIVGASICGNYNFGPNYANESTVNTDGSNRNIGGDDVAIGAAQSVADFTGFVPVGGNFVTSIILQNSTEFDSNGAPIDGQTWTFSAQVIPVPAAVWLFGSALGLLGWVRRRA